MSTPAGTERPGGLPLVVGLVAAFGLFLDARRGDCVRAELRCAAVRRPGQIEVTLTAGETVTMAVGAGDAITATVRWRQQGQLRRHDTTSNTIVVYGTDAGNETVTIEQSAARFEPGCDVRDRAARSQRDRVADQPRRGHHRPPDRSGGDDNDTLIINDMQAAGAVTIGEDGDRCSTMAFRRRRRLLASRGRR